MIYCLYSIIDFFSVDGNMPWSIDADFDLIVDYAEHRDFDIAANDESLSCTPCKYKHDNLLLSNDINFC